MRQRWRRRRLKSETKLVEVWLEVNKYLRTCGQKMWNRHNSSSIGNRSCRSESKSWIAATSTTTKNANFQSKQTKAKSNQSEPSRAAKSENQFVKSNNWNGHERITHATRRTNRSFFCYFFFLALCCFSSAACPYKSKYFTAQRKQIYFKSRGPRQRVCTPLLAFALQFVAFAISCAN